MIPGIVACRPMASGGVIGGYTGNNLMAVSISVAGDERILLINPADMSLITTIDLTGFGLRGAKLSKKNKRIICPIINSPYSRSYLTIPPYDFNSGSFTTSAIVSIENGIIPGGDEILIISCSSSPWLVIRRSSSDGTGIGSYSSVSNPASLPSTAARAIAFNSDGSLVALLWFGIYVKIFDTSTVPFTLITTITDGATNISVNPRNDNLKFTADDNYLVYGWRSGNKIRVWETTTWTRVDTSVLASATAWGLDVDLVNNKIITLGKPEEGSLIYPYTTKIYTPGTPFLESSLGLEYSNAEGFDHTLIKINNTSNRIAIGKNSSSDCVKAYTYPELVEFDLSAILGGGSLTCYSIDFGDN